MTGMPKPTVAEQAGIDQLERALDDLAKFAAHTVRIRRVEGNSDNYAEHVYTLEQVIEQLPEGRAHQLLAMLLGRHASYRAAGAAAQGFIEQTLYANEGNAPGTTWTNRDVVEMLELARDLLTGARHG